MADKKDISRATPSDDVFDQSKMSTNQFDPSAPFEQRGKHNPSAPRVVTDDQVIRAWEKFYWTDTLPKGWKPTQRDMQRMTEVLEDFATSLPLAAVPNGWSLVGEVSSMPGTGGFTMAAFNADEVPVGTALYAAAPQAGEKG